LRAAKVLLLFGGVYVGQANLVLGVGVIQQGDSIPISHRNDAAREGGGVSATEGADEQHGEQAFERHGGFGVSEFVTGSCL